MSPAPVAPAPRSARLRGALGRSWHRREVVVLHGQVDDLFELPDGGWTSLDRYVAVEAETAGRRTVVLGTTRVEQLVLPGQGLEALTVPVASPDLVAGLSELTATLEALSAVGWTVVVRAADLTLGAADSPGAAVVAELLTSWTREPALAAHRLVLLAARELDARILAIPGVRCIPVELPDTAERARAVARLQHRPGPGGLAPSFDEDAAAALSAGLRCADLHGLFSDEVSAADVVEEKRRRLTSTGGLRLLQGAGSLDEVAGLPQVRLALSEWQARGHAPRVLLLAGPPGCGKTLVVTALAAALGRAALELGEYRSPWVGQTESNLRARLELSEQLAPALVLVDEADLVLARRDGGPSADGGTNERSMAMLWTHLGDRREAGGTSWVLTTNRPGAIDEAGRDRLEEVIPVLHPDTEEAVRIFTLALGRRGQQAAPEALRTFAGRLRPFSSGRHVVGVAERAATFAEVARGRAAQVEAVDVLAGLDDLLPGDSSESVELMSLHAVRLTTYASRLPWLAAHALGQAATPPTWVRPLLDDDGRPVRARLDRRIAELQSVTGLR